MTRLLSSAILLAAAFAADPIMMTGTWNLDGNVQGYPITEVCQLTQADDATITGTCNDTRLDRTVTGKVTDKGITFSHPSEYQGDALTLTYAGTFDEKGVLNGTIDVQPLDYQGIFSATKAPPKP